LTGFCIVGWLMVAHALLVYPLLGVLAGHVYPRQPMFGAAARPTVIFTFGLLLTSTRVPKYLLLVPFAWALRVSAPN